MQKSIVILGGGTAGLIAALTLKTHNTELDITVVESKKIGIIGVGEGSTEHWATWTQFCKIDITEIFRETGATYKNGIKFVNWNGDGDHYWHALPLEASTIDQQSGLYPILMDAIANEKHSDSTVWQSCLDHTVIEPYAQATSQFHFDTNKLNNYFHKIGTDRGIKFRTDDIVDVLLDEEGFVKTLVGEESNYSADFFIDASGFRRVISSKLGVGWNDVSQYLPMNKAIAFPTPGTDDIPPYTSATAMSSGWMWRIPTQERFGNGYVYSDKFISDEDALAEAQSVFDHPIEVARSISFSAGYVDQFWVKNCLNIGLSGMFVEPLEASSIGSTIQQMFAFMVCLKHWERNDTRLMTEYNTAMDRMAKNIVDFIQLHYITKRRDSDFWKWCASSLELTDFNKETFEIFKKTYPSNIYFNDYWWMFKGLNWTQVMHGLGHMDSTRAKEFMSSFQDITGHAKFLYANKDGREQLSAIPAKQAIEIVKQRSYQSISSGNASVSELLGSNKWNIHY